MYSSFAVLAVPYCTITGVQGAQTYFIRGSWSNLYGGGYIPVHLKSKLYHNSIPLASFLPGGTLNFKNYSALEGYTLYCFHPLFLENFISLVKI
jgi:hypothetical protein